MVADITKKREVVLFLDAMVNLKLIDGDDWCAVTGCRYSFGFDSFGNRPINRKYIYGINGIIHDIQKDNWWL